MNRFSSLVAILVIPLALFAQPKSAGSGQSSMLVSASWLADHLKDPSVIIFHVAQNRTEFKNGHIPGARFLWSQALAYTDPDLTLELPSLAQADSVLKNLGISDRVTIVLYFGASNVTPTTRVYLTLEYLGLGDHVSFLDGGLEAWKAEGRVVSTEPVSYSPGTYVPQKKTVTVGWEWVKDNLDNPKVSIVDARGAQFYAGNGGGMPRAGHLPNAASIPFSTLVDSTNKLKDVAILKKIFSDAGVKPGNTVVSYCHIGQQATLVYFVAKYLGYDARVYDGSFEEWSGRTDLPVVNPAATMQKK
jgi:thiosulfate/3-mercaptopyruvate sulfurtransferase